MTAITAISGIQKNISKKGIFVLLAWFPCLKQAPNLLRATLSLHKHLLGGIYWSNMSFKNHKFIDYILGQLHCIAVKVLNYYYLLALKSFDTSVEHRHWTPALNTGVKHRRWKLALNTSVENRRWTPAYFISFHWKLIFYYPWGNKIIHWWCTGACSTDWTAPQIKRLVENQNNLFCVPF